MGCTRVLLLLALRLVFAFLIRRTESRHKHTSSSAENGAGFTEGVAVGGERGVIPAAALAYGNGEGSGWCIGW